MNFSPGAQPVVPLSAAEDWQGFCTFSGNTLTMAIGDMIVARINEISFVLSLGVCAWFYRQFRQLEIQQYNEDLLEQLFSEKTT
ncbi:hypothetical protein [Flaviaesturariibacter aridisoli]|uniref:Uncharacterized protein n=1 Tax=Flaviaesturariibacter aridisoli TaxID=2545761 RepID=A0A4R4DTG4_9BACT|nr:hypothetical protein [Flaviaesturariibacter aridisoli]TCZ65278.1 hypothetical protein E0486_17445 [Flaviaesturariibacter aridisoli]